MIPDAIADRIAVTTTTPKTVQPCPRTSSRERENDSPTCFPSRTITGTIKHHQVKKIRPGTMKQHQPDRDSEGREYPGQNQGAEVGTRALEQLSDRAVDPAVAHVVHCKHERALQPERADEGDDPAVRSASSSAMPTLCPNRVATSA